MKKVFAILSMLLLTIACVGVSVKNAPAQAASGKITADPTLAEDEIPVYIMNSIMTTFPNYYDNDANPDPNWQGVARMYPWNETRLRVAQLDANGQPTGKYYAIYFAGHTQATENGDAVIGAGKNILFWNVDENGNVVAEKYSDGKKASSGAASDPSLSHMRTNISGKDIVVDPTKVSLGDGEGTNFYNRSYVCDGQGRIIRGIALDAVYSSAVAEEGEIKFAPEYCRVDGVITKIEDGVVCDKLLKEKVDEEGNTVMGEDGNPVMELSDEDDLLYSRFVWEFFTTEPTNVNTVPYLSEGWDAMLWDYCYPVDGGYMAIAFVGSADNSAHVVKGDQVEPYKATLIARYVASGMSEAEATTKAEKEVAVPRECVRELRIPAGGFTFDYGYLDRGKVVCDEAFNSTVINGYLYGRQLLTKLDREGNPVLDEEGNPVKIGMAEQRTYNFSVGDVKFDDKVIDETSYRLVNLPATGLNVVEIMQGNTFSPTKNINYNGVMRYWGVQDDLESYTASAEALELYISESFNGATAATVVQPNTGYTSQRDVAEDFTKDFNEFLAKKGEYTLNEETGKYEKKDEEGNIVTYTELPVPSSDTPITTTSSWYSNRYEIASDGDGYDSFCENETYWAKWSWMFEYIATTLTRNVDGYNGDSSVSEARTVISPGNHVYVVYSFLAESAKIGGWPTNKIDWSNGVATEWLDSRTNVEKWADYVIDASTKAVGDNWTVTYKVVNSETGNSSELTVKYVVVDSYTPVISFDAAKLRYVPRKVGDSYVIDAINPYEIVKAYDGQYNGVNILGNDISQNIVFDTELDFNNPVEGKHEVVAKITNNAGTKEASVKFVVNVVDVTAPMVATRTVTIQQGQNFDPRDGITVAFDNVDGNLNDVDYEWWYQTSPAKAVDTNNLNGSNRTINITVEVSDRTGNVTKAQYQLIIIANKTSDEAISNLDKKVSQLQNSIDDVLDAIDEVKDAVDELTDKVNAMDANITATKSTVDAVKTSVDATKVTVDAVKAEVATVKANADEIKDVVDAVKQNTDAIKGSVDSVKGTVESVKTTVESINGEVSKSGCKSGALIALGLSTLIAVVAVVLKKRH